MYNDAFAFYSHVHEATNDERNALEHALDQLAQPPIFA